MDTLTDSKKPMLPVWQFFYINKLLYFCVTYLTLNLQLFIQNYSYEGVFYILQTNTKTNTCFELFLVSNV